MIGGSVFFSSDSSPAQAAVSAWQKGVSINPVSADDFSSTTFQQSVRDAAAMGANSVSLIIPFYQSSLTSSDIAPGNNTPTDASLISAIDYIHSLNLRVDLKLHLEDSGDLSQWRANINASDRDAWYAAYEAMLQHYASIAQQHHVEEITIGTELIDMASSYVNLDNTERWVKIISDVRTQFSGSLSYSANWGSSIWNDEKNHIGFWDKLDSIGISAYLPLATSNSYTLASLEKTWANWNASNIKPLYDTYHKPIVFTEVGYRSMDGALIRPSQWQPQNGVDLQEQVDGFQSLFEYWSQVAYFGGINIWDWSSNPTAGGSTDNDFTPQHKPAQDLIHQWFTDTIQASPSVNPASAGDIVLHASDALTSNIHGNWQLSPIADAADSVALLNTDHGVAKVLASATPTDYVDLTFSAQAGVPYHLWLRMKASKNNYNNDSVYVQFSDTTDKNKIGTANAYSVILEEGSGANVSGWGWNDTSYGSLGANITFTSSGTHTIRIQAREDGVLIDQILLSPTTYLSSNPGLFKNDTTIIQKNSGVSPTPATATQVQVTNPSDGEAVQGVVDLQAQVSGRNSNQYNMYWQVDNDHLNLMDITDDGSGKHAWIDVTGWNWHSDGLYPLTFIAQDMSGQEIARTTLTISVH